MDHPLVRAKLSLLRNRDTTAKETRELVKELALILAFEATRDLPLVSLGQRASPMGTYEAFGIGERICLFPVLRSGLGMVDAFLTMLPSSKVHHIGIYRESATLSPVEYYNKLPSQCDSDRGFILDPMVATGGTAIVCVHMLKEWGLQRIHLVVLVASEKGIQAVRKAHPDIEITCAAIDDTLDEQGYVCPGLGDAGDRLFSTK